MWDLSGIDCVGLSVRWLSVGGRGDMRVAILKEKGAIKISSSFYYKVQKMGSGQLGPITALKVT